ncbi:MAG: formylglycine-generating enzyme family protein [Cyanobacteriota bacterium]
MPLSRAMAGSAAGSMTNTAPSVTFLLRQPRQVQGYREVLAADQPPERALTLLWIPPGRFWMGSPATEVGRNDSEGPQHLVQLQGFFMAQTPITRGQWRVVAGWDPVERELEPKLAADSISRQRERSRKGDRDVNDGLVVAARLLKGEADTDQRPVEDVSWEDATEFCARLSQRTGRRYTLPSEAQWEYACRAGTTTPFHYGPTLTTELANYNGFSTYANGPKGEFRKQSTPVGMFPANAWGLQDMHGNVWEWCLDHWHESYEGAPTDGSAWLDGEGLNRNENKRKARLLRGGSWPHVPGLCRSACRFSNSPDLRFDVVGFRVCCLPQD